VPENLGKGDPPLAGRIPVLNEKKSRIWGYDCPAIDEIDCGRGDPAEGGRLPALKSTRINFKGL
jgi:hypothetical protein